MRFLIFIYGKSRMKRTQLVSDKRAECHILLPKDDFSLERTVFLQFKNISGEWFIKETDCCHLKTEEFFQKKVQRDREARKEYRRARTGKASVDDIYMIDIMRRGMENEGFRIR